MSAGKSGKGAAGETRAEGRPTRAERALWMSMARLVSHLSREANRAVESRHGLTLSQMTTLGLLRSRGAPARMAELAAGLQLTKPAITKIVDGLEASRWVGRTPDPDDRRAVRVELTASGRELLGQAERTFEGVMRERLWSHLNEDEVAAAAAVLRKVEVESDLPSGPVLPP